MTRGSLATLALLAVLALPASASAQWQNGDLSLRTSGSVARVGDRIRVELLALNPIPGPFFTQVTYRFQERVVVRDKDGVETTEVKDRETRRPRGPVIDNLDRLASLVVDDTFRFGVASANGRYEVEVSIYTGAGAAPVGRVTSCIVLQNDEEQPAAAGTQPCGLSLKGVKRVVAPGWITFDGNFPGYGRYSVVFSREGRILGYLETGITPTGPHELDIVSPGLAALAGQTVDVLLHNHERSVSSTLARVVLPRGPEAP